MKDKSAALSLAAPSSQNLWMGIAAVALALMAWKATGQVGFMVMTAGMAALTPAWAFRMAGAGRASPKWARSLVAPGLFLIVAGIFQILAR